MVQTRRLNNLFFTPFETKYGNMAILWQTGKKDTTVCRIFLPKKGKRIEHLIRAAAPGAQQNRIPHIDELTKKIVTFLNGQDTIFDLNTLCLDECSDFQRKVLLAEAEIPRGWVSTYGRISRHLGISGGARAVGSALANNPFPIVIPCHRAIRADGTTGGYQGGVKMKEELLRLEGIDVSPSGIVRAARMYFT